MPTQIKEKPITLRSVIRGRAFREGIEHYCKGLPPAFDGAGRDTNKAWAYERGRLFAAWARGRGEGIPRAYVNGKLSWQFIDMADDAARAGQRQGPRPRS